MINWRTLPGWAYLVIGFGFIFLPVVILVLFSFTSKEIPLPPFEGPSLRWYVEVFQNERLVNALINSVIVGVASSLVATTLGFLAAYSIARNTSRLDGLMRYAMMAPITVSYLIIGMGLLISLHVIGVHKSLWTGRGRSRNHQPAALLWHRFCGPGRASTQHREGRSRPGRERSADLVVGHCAHAAALPVCGVLYLLYPFVG